MDCSLAWLFTSKAGGVSSSMAALAKRGMSRFSGRPTVTKLITPMVI
jgi:hypothetical protein